MKLAQVKAGLNTPYGMVKYISGISKDGTKEPLWQKNDYKFWWVLTVRIEKDLVNLRFDYNDNYDSCKYSWESHDVWRKKLK